MYFKEHAMRGFSGKGRHGPPMMALKCAVWLALGALVVWLVMMLWNWLMPAVFSGARVIDYWQALGLIVLSRVLFGGGRGWKGRRHRHAMDADEREQFKRRFKGRCGDETKAAADAP
jgi:hypothetical protein